MAQPLSSWTCDSCGGPIHEPSNALLVWGRDVAGRATDFLIVHKNLDPGQHCDPDKARYSSSMELSNYLGSDGLAALLSLLSAGPLLGETKGFPRVANFDKYVDVVRRLQTPWYEEARRLFRDAEVQEHLRDGSESYPYQPAVLERIANGTL